MISRPGPIIVTGCQRSGTMLASQIIAAGLGYAFMEEFDILPQRGGINVIKALYDAGRTDVVIQAPFALQIYEKIIPLVPTVHFVGVVRPKEEIIESMKRIKWCQEDHENWKEYIDKHVDKMILLWEKLKLNVCPANWSELHYKDLKDHPFFVNKENRQNFTVKQWHPDKPCQFKTWSNNSKCIEDKINKD